MLSFGFPAGAVRSTPVAGATARFTHSEESFFADAGWVTFRLNCGHC
jgi:hypothetical protein